MADTKLTAVIQLADKMSKPLKGINNRLQNVQKPIKGLSNQLGRLDRVSGLKKLRSSLGGVAGQLGKLSLIGVGGIGAMVTAVNKLSQSGDEVIKTATNFGISAEKLQEYRFIAERSGVSQASVNKSMQAFTKRLAEARNGTGELYGLLKDVNPEFLNQLLAINDNGEAYDLLIRKMAELPEQQRQILLGDKAFSEAGRELVKITAQGADAIEELRKEAHKYGAVIDEETLKKSAEFQDNMTNLGSIAKNLAFSFGQEMMPAIQGIVTSMTEWGAQNKELIKTKLQEVAEKIAQSIKTLGENLPGIIDRVSRFVDAIGGMKTVLIGAGLVITGPLISAIATLSATLLTTPVGWFIGAVGLIAGAGAMIMGKWNPVEKFFPDLWDGIVEHVGGTIYKMVELFQNFTPAGLIIKHWDPLTDFFSDTWQNILKIFEAGMAKVMPIVNKLTKVADKVTKPVKKLFEFGGNAADAVTGAASDAYNGVRNFFGGDDTPRESILPKGQATQVGGQVTVKIDSEGRPKVQQVRSDNPSVGIDVDAGMSLVGAM
jgi:hypothetical protein